MQMTTSSMKKISAAAIVAVLGLSGMSHAAQIPYYTTFPIAPATDVQSQSYTAGTLEGQNGWKDEAGDPTNVASVGATGVTLNAAPAAGAYSDVYNSNIADHTGTNLNPATYGGFVNVTYKLNITAPTGSQSIASVTNPESAAGFGVDVLGSDDSLLASLYTVANPAHAGEEDVVIDGGTPSQVTDPILAPPGNGTTETYTLAMNFTNNTFQVFAGGVAGGTYALPAGLQIGGIALGTDNGGTDQAVFSAFQVVPEPASLAMVGLGGLMLLARRPKRTV